MTLAELCEAIVEHARYLFHRSPKTVHTVKYTRKALEAKFGAILADCGSEVSKVLAADLIAHCTDRNIRTTLRLCKRSLADKGVSPASKMNAMQFVMILAFSNEYNAYKVAGSAALHTIYLLGSADASRSGHPLFGECVNKTQLFKCVMCAQNVIETLSKVKSFDLTFHKRLPFGVRRLLSKCNAYRLKMLAHGVVLPSNNSISTKVTGSGSNASSIKDSTEQMRVKSCRTRVKEIEFRLSVAEDELRELGIIGATGAGVQRQRSGSAVDTEIRLAELVSTLCHLGMESTCLLSDVLQSNEHGLHEEVHALIDHIKQVETTCHSGYMRHADSGDAEIAHITLDGIEKVDDYCQEEFHTSRERHDMSYIVRLAQSESISAQSYKTARMDLTARESLSECGDDGRRAVAPKADEVEDEEVEEVVEDTDEDDVAAEWARVSAPKSKSLDSNDINAAATRDTIHDNWAVFSDIDDDTVDIFDLNAAVSTSLETDVSRPTAAAHSMARAAGGAKKARPEHIIELESECFQLMDPKSELETDMSSSEAPDRDAAPKADHVQHNIIAARNVLGMIRSCIGATTTDDTQRGDAGNMSARVLASLPNVHPSRGSVNSVLESDSLGDDALESYRSTVGTDSARGRSAPRWMTEIADDDDDSEPRSVESPNLCNLRDIRRIVVSRTPEIYRNERIRVTFKQQLVSEGTGKALECRLTLNNIGERVIDQLQFDFLNFEHFPIHLALAPMQENTNVIEPNGALDFNFKLYLLAPFIGLPKIKVITAAGAKEAENTYTLYLPVPIASFLVPEQPDDAMAVDALTRQSKVYYLIRNTVPFKKVARFASFGGHLHGVKSGPADSSVCFLAALHESVYEGDRNEGRSSYKVLVKLEAAEEPSSFSMYVYSSNDRLSAAVAQLYKYLFHNKAEAYAG